MAIATDIEIQNDKDIRYIGAAHGASGAGYYTGLEFHDWLRTLADDATAAPDDFLDMSRDTPSEKKFDTIIELLNGYNIDQTLAEHLYDTSIIQAGGDDIWDGVSVTANAGTFMEIIQNGALIGNDFWNNTPFGAATLGLNPDAAAGISHRFILKSRTAGADIDGRRAVATTREFNFNYGERKFTMNRGVNSVALAGGDTDLNNQTAAGTVATWTGVTNVEGYQGLDINNDTVDEFFYSQWNRDTFSIRQMTERLKWLTRRGTGSTIYGMSGDLFRGITHEINVDTPTGTFSAVEAVSWSGGTGRMLAINSTTAATNMWIQLLTGVPPTDGQTITGGTSFATVDVNVTVTEREIKAPFFGLATATSIVGAFGFGAEPTDLSSADVMRALDNATYSPPNFVTFTFGGAASGDALLAAPLGYRFQYDNEGGTPPFQVGETLTFTSPAGTAILADLIDWGTTGELVIGEMLTGTKPTDNSTISGGTSGATADVNGTVHDSINKRQMTLNGALSGGAVTAVVVNGAIPSDTPTGTNAFNIRIKRADNVYTRHSVVSWTGSTFTIASTDFASNNAANGTQVYIEYIGKTTAGTSESFTSVFASARNLFLRLRNGAAPIKTFESTGQLASTGGSATASRISDA